jgi:hypothetical protein
VDSDFRTSQPEGRGAPEGTSRPGMSRRSALSRAVGVTAAGLAASAIAGAAGPALAATARPAQRGPRPDHASQGAPARRTAADLVVHVRDARSGEMDVFSGTSMTQLRDKDLAAALMRAIG